MQDDQTITLNKNCDKDVNVSRTVKFKLDTDGKEFTGEIKGSGYYAVTKGEPDGTTVEYTVYYAGPYTYSVKTEAAENVELKVSATSVPAGETVTVTPAPAENYHVSAVTVTAANGKDVEVTDNKDGTYTFKMPASNVTVTATTYECPSLAFPDIDLTQWYHPYTDYAIAHDLMVGTDLGFEPNDIINREQMAAMLYFYEQKLGAGGFTGDWMFNLPYDDAADISDWAFEAVAWCTMKEVIKGDNNKFNPAHTSNRAQLATILSLYDQLTK